MNYDYLLGARKENPSPGGVPFSSCLLAKYAETVTLPHAREEKEAES